MTMRSPGTRATHAAGWAVRRVVDTATRVRERGVFGGLVMAPIEDLTSWALAEREEIVRVAAPDGTVTIMFTDIEDSTPLNEDLGDAEFVKLLARHSRVVTQQVERLRAAAGLAETCEQRHRARADADRNHHMRDARAPASSHRGRAPRADAGLIGAHAARGDAVARQGGEEPRG